MRLGAPSLTVAAPPQGPEPHWPGAHRGLERPPAPQDPEPHWLGSSTSGAGGASCPPGPRAALARVLHIRGAGAVSCLRALSRIGSGPIAGRSSLPASGPRAALARGLSTAEGPFFQPQSPEPHWLGAPSLTFAASPPQGPAWGPSRAGATSCLGPRAALARGPSRAGGAGLLPPRTPRRTCPGPPHQGLSPRTPSRTYPGPLHQGMERPPASGPRAALARGPSRAGAALPASGPRAALTRGLSTAGAAFFQPQSPEPHWPGTLHWPEYRLPQGPEPHWLGALSLLQRPPAARPRAAGSGPCIGWRLPQSL